VNVCVILKAIFKIFVVIARPLIQERLSKDQ
jgi:hypothetical protein